MNTLRFTSRNSKAVFASVLWRLFPVVMGLLVLTPYVGVLLDHHYLDKVPFHSHPVGVSSDHQHSALTHDHNDLNLEFNVPTFYKDGFASFGFCSDCQHVYMNLRIGPTGYFILGLFQNYIIQNIYPYPESPPPLFGK